MGFREQDHSQVCRYCEGFAQEVCGHCRMPLCGTHAPEVDGHFCTACERRVKVEAGWDSKIIESRGHYLRHGVLVASVVSPFIGVILAIHYWGPALLLVPAAIISHFVGPKLVELQEDRRLRQVVDAKRAELKKLPLTEHSQDQR